MNALLPSRGSVVALLAAVLSVFAVGVLGGFIYAHEPAAPVTSTTLQAAPVAAERDLRGAVTAVGSDFIEVATANGVTRLTRTADTPVEALVPVREVPTGAGGNLGGNRTESGFVLTGVVFVETSP